MLPLTPTPILITKNIFKVSHHRIQDGRIFCCFLELLTSQPFRETTNIFLETLTFIRAHFVRLETQFVNTIVQSLGKLAEEIFGLLLFGLLLGRRDLRMRS